MSTRSTHPRGTSPSPNAGPGVPRTPAHGFLDEDGVADGHEHGERDDAAPREDELIGSASSHRPAPDTRAEEPSGEVTPGAETD